MGGKLDKAKGRAKKAAGDLTENQSLKERGHVDKAKGKTKSGVDKAAKKVKSGIKKVG
ncbi:MAG TPA: CsbD family protein [Solirubrobacterales bacterium]|nr:CsbD family protein [Solirubrobacterales bacterium]